MKTQRYHDDTVQEPWRSSGKVKLFASTFFIVALLGLIWTLFQPVVYRSSATVLMSAPTAIDASATEANIQNVAIQRTILLGEEIKRYLREELDSDYGFQLTRDDLRGVLAITPVPETNLIEMIAEGGEGEMLPQIVSTWMEVYARIRAEDIESSKNQTLRLVQEELDGLAGKIDNSRAALEEYRIRHDIISAEREENEVLSRLDGLNKALNNAIEEEVKTKVYLDSVRASMANGRVMLPEEELRSLQSLESELEELRVQMIELRKRYTTDYIEKQPAMRSIPTRIDELEDEIASRMTEGQAVELASAQQAHFAAVRAVEELEKKLESHRQKVSEFSSIYSNHEALVADLASLEELNREAQARLVQVEVRQVEKYPQVTVIEPPASSSVRVGPNYLFLVGGTLAAALVSGILVVWLYKFLGHDKPEPGYVTLSGVHLYPQEVTGELTYAGEADHRLSREETRLLGDKSADSDVRDMGKDR